MHRPEPRWDSNFRMAGIAVVWLLTGGMLVGLAAFDAAGKTELMFPLLAAPVALTMLLVGGLVRAWKHVLSACSLLGLWFAVLPAIRWGPLKGFYMDCHRIEPGMPVARAAKIMSRYLLDEFPVRLERDLAEARQIPEGAGPPPDAVPDRFVFIPDLENRADWCMVYASGHFVRDVEESRD
jgi:hypothetical protein